MTGDQLVGFAFLAGMVATPFVAPVILSLVDRLRAEREWRAGRVARMVAAAEREGRRA